ncbi:MAG: hypothetical protein ACR2J5_08265 [Geodermatophilaceae bacterium]
MLGATVVATFVNTIVIAYDQRDVRGPIRSRLLALWLFIVFGSPPWSPCRCCCSVRA